MAILFFVSIFIYLCGFLVTLSTNPQQPPQQEVGDLELGENLGQRADSAENLTDHTVRSAQRRVNFGANTCITTTNKKK